MKTVFVGGCARSGTTLLGSILGTHTQCLATPESKFNVEVYLDCVRQSTTFEVIDAFNKIRRHLDFKGWDIDIERMSLSELQQCRDYPALVKWLVGQYAANVGRPVPDFWIDHTPTNIDHTTTLFTLFPDAKMIHLVRDGRAVASSVMKLDWGPSTAIVAAHWWIKQVAQGLVAEASFGSERVRRVRFEDLILDTQTTVQEICAFLGIEFQPDMVTGKGFHVPKYIAQQHPLIGSAPKANRTCAWQNELTQRQIEIFESIGGQVLNCLGYDLSFGFGARPVRGVELLRLGIEELYRDFIINKLHRRVRLRQVNHKKTIANPSQ